MKTCCDCKKELPLEKFTAKKTCKDGYEPRCKTCRSIKYNKSTPELLVKKIYATQLINSKRRKHPAPAYSKEELLNWVIACPRFTSLWENFITSGHKKDQIPSIDRIDVNKPYSLTNIQLLTWKENKQKGSQEIKNNLLIVNQRAVSAYRKDGSLYKTYLSMSEAMREFGGIGVQSWGISTVCNGTQVKDGKGYLYTPKTYKGFIWKWA